MIQGFDLLNPGDNILDSGELVGVHNGDTLLVGDGNPHLNGNHLVNDGDSEGVEHVFTFAESPGDAGAPTSGTCYIEGISDNHGGNFSMGVWNSAHGTQYNTTYNDGGDWGWGFGPNGAAHSGPDVFDSANSHRSIHAVNVEGGFVTTYSFEAHDLVTGASWGHGGADGVPNHIPGFGTPTLRVYYDRRGGQDIEIDDLRIATTAYVPDPIPEPATFALLGLSSLLMLRRRV